MVQYVILLHTDPINCAYQELPSTLQLVSYSFGGFIVLFTIIGATLVCIWKRMTKKCIKWYYEKTLLNKLKQMLSLLKFRRNSRQQCLEETVLLNCDDTSSLQSEDNEYISYANVLTKSTDSDNSSEKSISTYQESDSAIAMMESSLSSNSSQAMPTPPVVVETMSPAVESPADESRVVETMSPAVESPADESRVVETMSPAVESPADEEMVFPAVEEMVFPAVVESTSPAAATEMTSLQEFEVEQEESAYEMQVRCLWIKPTGPAGQSNYSHNLAIAHGNYASDAIVNTQSDADHLFPSVITEKIKEVRKQKQCKTDRINLQYYYGSTTNMTHNYVEDTVNIVEDDMLEELLLNLAQR